MLLQFIINCKGWRLRSRKVRRSSLKKKLRQEMISKLFVFILSWCSSKSDKRWSHPFIKIFEFLKYLSFSHFKLLMHCIIFLPPQLTLRFFRRNKKPELVLHSTWKWSFNGSLNSPQMSMKWYPIDCDNQNLQKNRGPTLNSNYGMWREPKK